MGSEQLDHERTMLMARLRGLVSARMVAEFDGAPINRFRDMVQTCDAQLAARARTGIETWGDRRAKTA
jgi:hypothetical protein